MALRIEDYAMIGDCETAGLVGRDGSIDLGLCWPRFDLAACFAALLGTSDDGRWLLAPESQPSKLHGAIAPDSILETEFRTETGTPVVIDFMPPADSVADLVRIVAAVGPGDISDRAGGTVRLRLDGTVGHTDRERHDRSDSGPGANSFPRTSAELYGEDLKTVGEFGIDAGQSVPFVLSYGRPLRKYAWADRSGEGARTHGSILASMERSMSGRCPLDGCRQAFPHHIEGADVCSNWRDGCRAHDVAS